MGPGHLIWILVAAVVGFLAAFLFADLLGLPSDLYYLIYFAIICTLFIAYARLTGLAIGDVASRRWLLALALGIVVGVVMIGRALSEPQTGRFMGAALVGEIVWRGLIYGAIDGLLLSGFPWLVAWRAYGAEAAGCGRRIAASLVAIIGVMIVTSVYHAGYLDFRGRKLAQADIGNLIMSAPTILSGNPMASAVTHAMLHTAAVVHAPGTSLFLPPHRQGQE